MGMWRWKGEESAKKKKEWRHLHFLGVCEYVWLIVLSCFRLNFHPKNKKSKGGLQEEGWRVDTYTHSDTHTHTLTLPLPPLTHPVFGFCPPETRSHVPQVALPFSISPSLLVSLSLWTICLYRYLSNTTHHPKKTTQILFVCRLVVRRRNIVHVCIILSVEGKSFVLTPESTHLATTTTPLYSLRIYPPPLQGCCSCCRCCCCCW